MLISINLKQAFCFLFITCLFTHFAHATENPQWSAAELSLLKMQWLESLPTLSSDPSNQYSNNIYAAKLGHELFFDPRFSSNGEVSCASCHIPNKLFTDGLAKAKGIGTTARNAPSIIGIAYSPWFFWDGRSDSLWSQALSPLEARDEHGSNRLHYARIIHGDPAYRKKYEKIFGVLPDLSDTERFPVGAAPNGDDEASAKWQRMLDHDRKAVTRVFVNMSKAIAAYERLLMPSSSRFDTYVAAVLQNEPSNALTNDEIAGLKLFIGKAMCISCHQGPLFSNHGFHNIGAPDPAGETSWIPFLDFFREKPLFDLGRYKGVRQVMASEFNCLGEYSDASVEDCAELKFANTKPIATMGAFKVPTLRNVTATAPYFHFGQFTTLGEVLDHYNTPPEAIVGHNELTPLNLNKTELGQLEAFLHSLSSPPAVTAEWLNPPSYNKFADR